MSVSVTNRLTISGNKQVQSFIQDLNEKFIKDEDVNGFRNNTAIRRLIYGHDLAIAQILSNDANTKDIYFFDESELRPTERCISFISNGSSTEDLEDYLLVILSQLDPWVIICNQSTDEYLGECSTRYSVMCDLASAEIKTSTTIPESKNQNEAFFKKVDKLALKDKEKAFKLVKKTFTWITDDMYL